MSSSPPMTARLAGYLCPSCDGPSSGGLCSHCASFGKSDGNAALLARIAALESALEQCRDQFQFYADEHSAAGKTEKAATNQRFADLAQAALTLNKDTPNAEG
jgi:hypothetical protein